MNKRNKYFIFILFLGNYIFAQTSTTIFGSIKDNVNNSVSASIILKDSLSKSIIGYTHSDNKGYYSINTKATGIINLTFTSLGYETKKTFIDIKKQKKINLNITLKEKAFELDEVIIKAEKPIKAKKDTIVFKTKYFKIDNGQTVENLINKLPGLSVDNNGTIRVGGQEIEKIMIDGDDLFENGYKILSKNMPAYSIEEVEVLKKYSNNHLLKDIEQSNKIALNLKLNEKSKRIWFGNIETSVGNNGFYQKKGNLMNFGKKNKYYFLTNFNNIGFDATGDIEHLIRPYRVNEPGTLGDNEKTDSFLSLKPDQLNFKQSRTNFNNAKLISLNAIFNPTKKLKIKTLVFFNWDETNFFRNSTNFVNVDATNFTNTKNYKLNNKKQIAFGKLDFIYNISKTKMLEATTKYNKGNFNDESNLTFNNIPTIENLQHQNILFDQKINYTNKFKDKKVFLLTGRFINEKTPQNYGANHFFHQNLFPSFDYVNNIKQQNSNQMQFAGINALLLDRKKNGNLLEIQLGNEFRKDRLETTFLLLKDNTALKNLTNYQNKTNYQVNDLYLKNKYRLKVNDFALTGILNLHQLFNKLQNNKVTTNQHPFFINLGLGFDWEINSKNKITSSFLYNTTNAKLLDVYSNFVLTGFSSFSKGTGTFNQLDASNIVFNYELGDWGDRFFANTFITYSKNHNFFSSNTNIQQNYTQSKKIIIKDRESISLNTNLDYYFKFISSNLKLNLGYNTSEYKNIINNSNLRQVTSKNYNYGLELRSGFNGIFNYHIGTNWKTSNIKATTENSFANNISFLNLSFIFNKNFNLQLQSERYYFGNLETNNTYYFLDFDANYKIIENKLTLGVTGKNIFNTEKFKDVLVSDIGTSKTLYRLLPRSILLKLEYRF